jgi:ribosome modulation factor
MTTPPQKPPRHRAPIKLMSKEEQSARSAQAEAGRLGRVAFHQRTGRDTCPYGADDPLRIAWLAGWDACKGRTHRFDVPAAEAEGNSAFRDGLRESECRFDVRSEERTQWLRGYERARGRKQKDDEKFR